MARKFDLLWHILEVCSYSTYPSMRRYKVLCRCGTVYEAPLVEIKRGKARDCGCSAKVLASTRARNTFTTHGLRGTSEYNSWVGMRQRCTNQRNPKYPSYGGRGISVAARWNRFENFLIDMGKKPGKEYSIDRVDNNGKYTPSNCRWATPSEQARNKRNTGG